MDKRKKVYLIIGLLILLFSIPLGVLLIRQQSNFRLGATSVNTPELVKTINLGPRSATISWTTEKPSQGMINYGLSPTNLSLIQPETAPAVNHQVSLANLLPESTYYYTIQVEDETFDNNGQPFSFSTTAAAATPSPLPSISEAGFTQAFGTNNPNYDLNQDGVVSMVDLLLFRQREK